VCSMCIEFVQVSESWIREEFGVLVGAAEILWCIGMRAVKVCAEHIIMLLEMHFIARASSESTQCGPFRPHTHVGACLHFSRLSRTQLPPPLNTTPWLIAKLRSLLPHSPSLLRRCLSPLASLFHSYLGLLMGTGNVRIRSSGAGQS
jgi:hypothetical protein